MIRTSLRRLVALVVLALPAGSSASPAPPRPDNGTGGEPRPPTGLPARARTRRPVALVLDDGERWLLAANRRSGSVSGIDLDAGRVVAEVDVGRGLADMARVPGEPWLVAADEDADELILLIARGAEVEAYDVMAVSPTPVSVAIAPDGGACAVASLWPRRVTLFRIVRPDGSPRTARLRTAHVIDLPFAPRRQLFLPGGAGLLVAEAFGGRLAVVDVAAGTLESTRSICGHNLRGLALGAGGESVLIAHQVLENRPPPEGGDGAHAPLAMKNVLRAIPLRDLAVPGDGPLGGELLRLDAFGAGAADPSAVALSANGSLSVTLSGSDEVAVGDPAAPGFTRVAVGRGPGAIALSADGTRLYAANRYADSVSVVDLPGRRSVRDIPLGPRMERVPIVDRGEAVFHDATLSGDGSMSCHSCHTDGHTSGLLADTLGDGTRGTPKRVLSLRGSTDTGPWAWNGSVPYLDVQIRKTVKATMRGGDVDDSKVNELTAFLRALAPPPGVAATTPAVENAAGAVARGRELFRRRCEKCHAPPEYTTPARYDVGFEDEAGRRRFNPPSLRGVSQRDGFFHDGRAGSLEEVLARLRHPKESEHTAEEVADLVSFLRTL